MFRVVSCSLFLGSVLMCFSLQAQKAELSRYHRQKIDSLKSEVEKVERDDLIQKVGDLNEQLENGEISDEEAASLKLEASKKTVQNIRDQHDIIDAVVDYRLRNGIPVLLESKLQQDILYLPNLRHVMENHAFAQKPSSGISSYEIIFGNGLTVRSNRKVGQTQEADSITYKDKESSMPKIQRTLSSLVMGITFNNAVESIGQIDNSPFRLAGSRSFEIGATFSSQPFRRINFFRIQYGFAFQFNGLKPEGNQIFVNEGAETQLQDFEIGGLDKNKFRMDNIIFPVHFQFGTPSVSGSDFSYHHLKLGVGGFIGLNYLNTQNLTYTTTEGADIAQRIREDFNTHQLLYGWSAYAGWESFHLYVTHNLNPIFKNNPTDLYNIQFGIRLLINEYNK